MQNGQRSDGGAHARLVAVGAGCTKDGFVGFGDGCRRGAFAGCSLSEALAQNACCERAGNFASLMTAHAIGHGKHHWLGDEGVFVGFADSTFIGCCTPSQFGHQSASSTMLPI